MIHQFTQDITIKVVQSQMFPTWAITKTLYKLATENATKPQEIGRTNHRENDIENCYNT